MPSSSTKKTTCSWTLLTGYVGGGIKAGECSIVIATPAHRSALEKRLADEWESMWGARGLRAGNMDLDAETTLARFMVNRMPDEELFSPIA